MSRTLRGQVQMYENVNSSCTKDMGAPTVVFRYLHTYTGAPNRRISLFTNMYRFLGDLIY